MFLAVNIHYNNNSTRTKMKRLDLIYHSGENGNLLIVKLTTSRNEFQQTSIITNAFYYEIIRKTISIILIYKLNLFYNIFKYIF